jgi:hypothetical protein
MRGSATVQVTIANFTLWRFGIASTGLALTAACAVWLIQAGVPAPGSAAGVAAVAGAAAWLGWPHLRVQPVSVRWDGASWYLGRVDAAFDEACRGAVHVQIDLGAWVLLRFVPENPSPGVQASWLPVQRQGTPPEWHALRCALYAPRPAAAVVAEEGEAAK